MKKNYFAIALIALFSLLATACGNKENTIYPIKIGDNWGYVTAKGKYVVNPSFESAGFFYCGRARIVKEGKVGYIDTKGKIVIAPIYENGSDFSENKAFVVKEGEIPQCINTSGKVIFTAPSSAEKVYTFIEGIAKVVNADNEITYLNTHGKEVVPNQSQNSSLCEGLAAMKGQNGKYGYIDAKGTLQIDFQFEEAHNFCEGLALVKTGKKYGYINKRGEFVINPQFVSARSFHEGMAAVEQDAAWGFINTSGNLSVPPVYDDVCDYLGGYALVMQDSKIGIINRKGKMVVNPQFDSAWRTVRGSQNDFVLSMKYTGTSFVPDFLCRHENGSWDGMNASTTLGEIRSKYKTAKANGDDQFVCETTFEPVEGITLSSIIFMFDDITYNMVDNYVQGWFFSYKSGKKRQYKNYLPLEALAYTLSLDSSTKHKVYSVAETLAEGMAQELEADVKYESDGDYNCFTLIKNDEEIAGVIFSRASQDVIVAIQMD